MCMAAQCATCGKTTWYGCGKHIESVKAKAGDNWCECEDHNPKQPACGDAF